MELAPRSSTTTPAPNAPNATIETYVAKTVDNFSVPFTTKQIDKKYIIAFLVIIPFLTLEIPGIVSYKTTRYPIDRCYRQKNDRSYDYSDYAMEPYAEPVYKCVRCFGSATFESDIGDGLVAFFMVWFVFVAIGVAYTVFYFIEHTATAQKFLPYGIVLTNNRRKLAIIIFVTIVFFIVWSVVRVKFNQASSYRYAYPCIGIDALANETIGYRLETSAIPTGGEVFARGILPLLFGYMALIKFYVDRMDNMFRDISTKDLLKDSELMRAFADHIKYKCSYRDVPGVLRNMRMTTDKYKSIRWYRCFSRYTYANDRRIVPAEMPALVQALHDANKIRNI